MLRSTQLKILEDLCEKLEKGLNHDTGRTVLNPTSSYVDEDLAEKEWESFFVKRPHVIGLSGDLPESGSYFSVDELGIPLIALRDTDKNFRVFVNTCRHRGSRLINGRGQTSRLLCPFHGWSYDLGGRLNSITDSHLFGSVDKDCSGLIELPASEKFGLLWMSPEPGAVLDVEYLLGAIGPELEEWRLQDHILCGEKVLRKNMNWKLANDTFGENYHFPVLHRNTLSSLFRGDVMSYEKFGLNHRFVFPGRKISELKKKPKRKWRLDGVATILYYLFPNIQLATSERQTTLFRIYPLKGNPRRSVTMVSHYFSSDALDLISSGEKTVIDASNTYDRKARDSNAIVSPEAAMEIIDSTVEQEDFKMAEESQISADSGLVENFIFGRNEAPLHHFHSSFRSELGLSPLKEL